jgi:hypothetical protein
MRSHLCSFTCLSVCPHTLPSDTFHLFEKSGMNVLPPQGTVFCIF